MPHTKGPNVAPMLMPMQKMVKAVSFRLSSGLQRLPTMVEMLGLKKPFPKIRKKSPPIIKMTVSWLSMAGSIIPSGSWMAGCTKHALRNMRNCPSAISKPPATMLRRLPQQRSAIYPPSNGVRYTNPVQQPYISLAASFVKSAAIMQSVNTALMPQQENLSAISVTNSR